VCIVLDAEYYVDRLGGPAIFEELQSGGSIPPVLVVYVSHLDSATRWTESFCNTSFDQFIVDELLPWVTKEYDLPATIDSVITGLSLTGLGAAHAALNARNRISRALCQSASFWWQQGWLVENLTTLPPSDVAFRISVGTEETIQNVDHGQGLIQSESQINANRRMHEALVARGHRVSYREFPGGHDLESWIADLPESLAALFRLESRRPDRNAW